VPPHLEFPRLLATHGSLGPIPNVSRLSKPIMLIALVERINIDLFLFLKGWRLFYCYLNRPTTLVLAFSYETFFPRIFTSLYQQLAQLALLNQFLLHISIPSYVNPKTLFQWLVFPHKPSHHVTEVKRCKEEMYA